MSKRRNRSFRATLTLVAFSMLAGFLLGLHYSSEVADHPAVPAHPVSAVQATPETVPACTDESGLKQPICYWDASEHGNGRGEDMVNMDFGRYTYYPESATMHDWTNE